MPSLSEALALQKAGDVAGAVAAYRALLGQNPENVAALANLASLVRGADPLEARDLVERAIALAPQSGSLRRNLGNLLRDEGRAEEAEAVYAAALALDPGDDQLAEDLARVRLAIGDFAAAWPLLERRADKSRAAAQRLSFPEWRGEPLAGRRLFVWPEQGFGDQILAARFLARLDGAVTLACRPELARLFAQLPAAVQPLAKQVAVAPHDYWTLPLSLPGRLGVTGADLAAAPYLAGTATRAGGVGVAWRGNALPDPGRSLPPQLGAALLAMPGAVSLQPEDSGAVDFQATADLIAGLDVVVSIDTSIAHLAGAMGKPTLVLLQKDVIEWRWRADRAGRSVWYPSAEVIRQPARGDWAGAVEAVKSRWPR
jgi:tetratricopeptide (TPR) repeat protein